MNNRYYFRYSIANFIFTIIEDNGFIVALNLDDKCLNAIYQETELILKTKQELMEYFSGTRKEFDLPIKLTGTPFQNKVWIEMQKIPYGEVITYHELAKRCGNEKASRAIGNVCHNNSILILIPCHRVVSSKGLGGFGCGILMKIKLLEKEGVL